MAIHLIVFIVSITLTLLFFLYGFNQYYLIRAARRYKTPALTKQLDRPPVSIHLPVYNEKYVVRRLIAACVAMAEEYGREKVTIMVLDDSTDDTTKEVDDTVDQFVRQGYHVKTLRRDNRNGYKAGALQEALVQTSEEFIAIFDADYIPTPGFLTQTVPYFAENDRIGIVQSRWLYLNREFNHLTKAIGIGIDIHFLIEQPGRYAAGCLQNFNGSGGVLRKKAVVEAGGWQADTLTEDLDLSYRMQLLGYHVLYLRDVESPGEIPPTIPSLMKQQNRWACGSLQTAKKLLPALLTNHQIAFKSRLQAFIHLTSYSVHVFMVLAFITSCVGAFYPTNESLTVNLFKGTEVSMLFPVSFLQVQNMIWGGLFPLIILCAVAPWVSAITTFTVQGKSVRRNLTSLFVLFLVGYGISISNTREAYKALFMKKSWEFVRTPKYADLEKNTGWQSLSYQIPLDPMWSLELIFVMLGAAAIGISLILGNYGGLLFLVPATAAYAYVLWMTLRESRGRRSK